MLNFYNCIRLLDEATHCGLIQRDPNIPDNILVYREAGEEDPEGWYSENLMSIVQELQDDEEGQTEILGALEEKTGQPFNEKPLPFPDTMRKDTYMQETTLRENLLVTFGSRAAYMDSIGKTAFRAGWMVKTRSQLPLWTSSTVSYPTLQGTRVSMNSSKPRSMNDSERRPLYERRYVR